VMSSRRGTAVKLAEGSRKVVLCGQRRQQIVTELAVPFDGCDNDPFRSSGRSARDSRVESEVSFLRCRSATSRRDARAGTITGEFICLIGNRKIPTKA
jgi:hypothetical protein